jgi:hypothetical protein
MPMWTSTRGVGTGPVGHHLGADQELAGLLEGVVVPLPGGAHVLRAAGLAECLQDGGDRRRALGGQVPADPPGPVQGRLQVQEPVPETPVAGLLVRVGLLDAPRLVGGLRDDLQIIQVRARRGGVHQDLVGFLLELLVVDPVVHPAISLAHEIVTAPAAVAASSSGWRPSSRICLTAACASLRLTMIIYLISVGCAIDRTSSWREPVTVRSRSWV